VEGLCARRRPGAQKLSPHAQATSTVVALLGANTMKIRLVCATRLAAEQFERDCALGRSIATFRDQYGTWFETRLFPENSSGLSTVYNIAIEEARDNPALLAFIHDDVWLMDLYWPQHLVEALQNYELVGVAGNRRRTPGQVSWGLIRDPLGNIGWDARDYLSGCVAHGPRTSSPQIKSVGYYGPARVEVKLLDGVLLFTHSETLLRHQLRFDERFDFHFYDLDLCRQAEAKGIRMGTWDISLIHCSEGSFQDPRWLSGYNAYIKKWGS
jgi:GT2 family glycosyltransferase